MTAAEGCSSCDRFERWLTPYVDGELDAVHILEVEAHLHECEQCAERVALAQAMKSSVKRSCSMRAPSRLRERVCAAIGHERELMAREPGREPSRHVAASLARASTAVGASDSVSPPSIGSQTLATAPARGHQLLRWRYLLPLAAAAALVLVLAGASGLQSVRPQIKAVSSASPKATSMQATMSSLEGLLEDLVVQHSKPLPLEEPDPGRLYTFEPHLGIRVPEPQPEKLKPLGVRFIGARVHQPLRNKRAAMLRYIVRDKHPVTLYVFDSKRVPLRANTDRFKHRFRRHYIKPSNVTVYTRRMSGYSVATSERNGVGYALATDLPDDESTKLILVVAE